MAQIRILEGHVVAAVLKLHSNSHTYSIAYNRNELRSDAPREHPQRRKKGYHLYGHTAAIGCAQTDAVRCKFTGSFSIGKLESVNRHDSITETLGGPNQ
ncbi:hypothetical protein ACKLNR_004149 [Fusarium oxysporum f. sp. zingiberi]